MQTPSGGPRAAWSYGYDDDYRILYSGENIIGTPDMPSPLSYVYYPHGRLAQYGVSNLLTLQSGQGNTNVFHDYDGHRLVWRTTSSARASAATRRQEVLRRTRASAATD